jgi:Flp pilus assembly protein TadD
MSLILGGDPRAGANVLLDVTRFPAAPPQARQNLALAYGLLGNTEAAAEILSKDLPKASVQDNLRFYEIQRARLGQPAANAEPAPPAVRVGTAPAAPVQAVSLR